ncbi:tRNA-dihydrouridine synthase [Candidatus Campbellbacteria bacterium CG22_combo_CG10-13_8_21_14_all_36_13]|uniref:tRNA-dihydrouridine synthase n=1 Tax=Candidatus Campbellbacteria bacterium CG22_combo_CG10-13_8_21_14_all_36_13 TaxID=1974529 RepID=A0A2H0DYG9_9BACT|nr:MAG: tRNA-dihydrouridine synthase [Candidatus Campbellbacteria bacterium CG22_combo_CG10-13_8_21_14_all_36_13]
MTDNFWQKLNKPFFALAPMADVTDAPFRAMFAKYGKPFGGPDVMWTEFISADGLFLGGFDALEKDLIYGENERPIVAQFFSKDPELMRRASELAVERGFDGVDINMGCPAAVICNQGAGAAIIKNKKLAKEIIRATKEGAGGSASWRIPVSVKTRTGYSKNEIEEWIPAILEEGVDALILHARTKKEMSKVPADWSAVARAVEIRDVMGVDTVIIGNGDVKSKEEGVRRAEETGCDGIMMGRGIFGNPWAMTDHQATKEERLNVMIEHAHLYEKIFEGRKPFALMKKHFKAYVSGWDGAKELRTKLMEAENADEVERIVYKVHKVESL